MSAARYADRRRRPGEDVVAYAAATGRISAARAGHWRAVAASGQDVSALEYLDAGLAGLMVAPPAVPAEDGLYVSLFGPAGAVGRPVAAAAGDPPAPGGPALAEPDAYAANPLVDEIRSRNPALYAAALADGPPPQLFESGALPPFTASGVDPMLLARLPWQARLAAASAPDRGEVLEIIEETQGDPGGAALSFAHHPGVDAYAARVRAWLSGPQQSSAGWA